MTAIERLRDIPAKARERVAAAYFGRTAIREYPEPQDFPHGVSFAVYALFGGAAVVGVIWAAWSALDCYLRATC
jgi:hypothetical protein